jgi:hypothetical protein
MFQITYTGIDATPMMKLERGVRRNAIVCAARKVRGGKAWKASDAGGRYRAHIL